jgi:hypothetical protein
MTSPTPAEHTALPWRIERDPKHAEYATVYDATGSCVPILTDIQLGWTDKTTAPYADPEKDYALLESVVSTVNSGPMLLEFRARLLGLVPKEDHDKCVNDPHWAEVCIRNNKQAAVNERAGLLQRVRKLEEVCNLVKDNAVFSPETNRATIDELVIERVRAVLHKTKAAE